MFEAVSQACLFFPAGRHRPQVPGAQLRRHTTIPAMPAEHSHREGGAVGGGWESEGATESGGEERFKGSICA